MRLPAGYRRCRDCGKPVKMVGVFAGWHLCVTDEELTAAGRRRKDTT